MDTFHQAVTGGGHQRDVLRQGQLGRGSGVGSRKHGGWHGVLGRFGWIRLVVKDGVQGHAHGFQVVGHGGAGVFRRAGLDGSEDLLVLNIGGMLAVWSELNAGTEVELTVPAAKAYEEIGQRSWLSRMLTMKHQ